MAASGQHGTARSVAVVGGANIDIAGKAAGPLVEFDSNPGHVSLSAGGVGRNIAHNLALLGEQVELISVLGDDANGAELARICREAGIGLEHALIAEGQRTSTYLFIMDETGEMRFAINDMAILDALTPAALESRLAVLNSASICFVDTNLPAATLAWLIDALEVPVFCDPISCAKAPRIGGSLAGIHTLKPNRWEAEVLTGTADPARAAERLIDAGVQRVFISLGADGLLCADDRGSIRIAQGPIEVASATGAGDAMMAALAWAYLEGMDTEQSGRAGLAASAICIASPETVSPHMCVEALRARMDGGVGL